MAIKSLLLAAGRGERLKPFTDIWPKCLMPINGEPLLSIWLNILLDNNINDILVNTSYLNKIVESFLKRNIYKDKLILSFEERLLGTAGTIRANYNYLKNNTIFLAHADNLCFANFSKFLRSHLERPSHCLITMMTFKTNDPQSCGIIETDDNNVVIKFHEKVKSPPSNKANGAVYLIEPDVINWINKEKDVKDFSNDVIPNFLNKIYCWTNVDKHIDIGTPENLNKAQQVVIPSKYLGAKDEWSVNFEKHPIHDMIKEYYNI